MKVATLFLLTLFFANLAAAAEPVDAIPALDLNGQKIHGAIETLPLFLEAFERGFPLVYQEKREEKEEKKTENKDEGNDFNKMLAGTKKVQSDLDEALKKNLAEIKKRRDERLAAKVEATPDAPAAKPEPAAKAAAAEPWSDKSFANFCECAKRSLPLLRAKRRAELSADQTVPLQLESLLIAERGNGKTIGEDGIACGKHLGPLAMTIADRNFELLLLLSLTKGASEERFKSLWEAFRTWAWVQQNGDKAKAADFWAYVMQRNLLRNLFARESVPSLATHIKEFVTIYSKPGAAEKGKVVLSVSESSIREAIDADLKQASVLTYEAKPCDKE